VTHQAARRRFEPDTASVTLARLFVRRLPYDLPGPVRDCLELVVSELATNAVIHAGSPFEVAVVHGPRIRVEVSDASSQPPVMGAPAAFDATGGRGLHLVDACAEKWGYDLLTNGKVVWASLLA
jgi:anti-sigma regulatory factor (Ser/Thr protein kinase)